MIYYNVYTDASVKPGLGFGGYGYRIETGVGPEDVVEGNGTFDTSHIVSLEMWAITMGLHAVPPGDSIVLVHTDCLTAVDPTLTAKWTGHQHAYPFLVVMRELIVAKRVILRHHPKALGHPEGLKWAHRLSRRAVRERIRREQVSRNVVPAV